MKLRTETSRARRGQRGAVAVAFILLIVALLGFVALATEVGRLYVSKAELQNAADACALSASAALTGANANQLDVAESYGIAAGTRNLIGMQESGVAIVADRDVTFSQTLNGAYQTKSAAAANALNMRYVRCTVSEADVQTLFIHVIRLIGETVGPSTIMATAVAGLTPSKSNCALPLAICEADIAGKPAGTWIQGLLNPGSGIQGAFKWIEFPGFERNKDLAALLEGAGQCDLNNTQTIASHPGYIDSMLNAWNTRFGVYKTGNGNPGPEDAAPDMTGWVYNPTLFPAQKDAMEDFLNKRKQATPKHQTNPTYKLPNNSFNWASDAEFQNGQDRRLVVGPVVDCNALGSNGTTEVKDWACYLMLNPVFGSGDIMYLEYRGMADEPSAGCVTSGAPGGSGAGGPKVPTLVQ